MATEANPASKASTVPAEASNVAGVNGQQPQQQSMPQVVLVQDGGRAALKPAVAADSGPMLFVDTSLLKASTAREAGLAQQLKRPSTGLLGLARSNEAHQAETHQAANASHLSLQLGSSPLLRPQVDSPTSPLNHAGLRRTVSSLPGRPLAVRRSQSDSPTNADAPLVLGLDDGKRGGNGHDVDPNYAGKAAKRAHLTRMLSTCPSSKEEEDTTIFDYPLRMAGIHTDLGRDVAIGTTAGLLKGAAKFYYDWIRPKKLTDFPVSMDLIKRSLPQPHHLNSPCKNFCKIVSRTFETIGMLADRVAIACARFWPLVLGVLGGAGPFGLWILNALAAITRVGVTPIAFTVILALALIAAAVAITAAAFYYIVLVGLCYYVIGRGVFEHLLYKGLLKTVIVGFLFQTILVGSYRWIADLDHKEANDYQLYKLTQVVANLGQATSELDLRTLKYALAHATRKDIEADVQDLSERIFAIEGPGCCAKIGSCFRNCCQALCRGDRSKPKVLGSRHPRLAPATEAMDADGVSPEAAALLSGAKDNSRLRGTDAVSTLDLSSSRGVTVASAHAAVRLESKAQDGAV